MVKRIISTLNVIMPFLQQRPKWIQVLVAAGLIYVFAVIVVILVWFLFFRSPQKEMSNSLNNYGRTQLYARTKKRIDDIYKNIESEKLNPWIFIKTGKMPEITMHNGKVISYKGFATEFSGTPVNVFWGDDFIPPFIEDAIIKVFDQTIEECRKNNLNPKPYIIEANSLLNGFIWKVYNRMADIDRRLKGHTKSGPRKDVSMKIEKMQERLKGHYDAAILLASKNEITGSISKSRTQIVGKFLAIFSIIWKILAGFTLLLGLFVSFITISSKISVRSDDPINCSDPFSTPFQIKNAGYIPVFNITLLCTIREVKFVNRASIYNIDTRTDNPPIPKICSGEETTTFFKCLPHKTSITSADIEIAVSYRPMWVFWKREKRFRFATISREDELYWVPLALSQ